MTRRRGVRVGRGGRRQILPVDADVKTRLLKLLLDINLAFLHQRQEVSAQPGDLGERETVLRDIDGLAGEVR